MERKLFLNAKNFLDMKVRDILNQGAKYEDPHTHRLRKGKIVSIHLSYIRLVNRDGFTIQVPFHKLFSL